MMINETIFTVSAALRETIDALAKSQGHWERIVPHYVAVRDALLARRAARVALGQLAASPDAELTESRTALAATEAQVAAALESLEAAL